jgi:hypothetical protein
VNAGGTLLKENLPALPIGIVRVCRSSFKLVNVGTVFELAVDGAEFGVGSLMMWLMPRSVALLMVLLTLRSNS